MDRQVAPAVGLALAVVLGGVVVASGGVAVPLSPVGGADAQETVDCSYPMTVTDATGSAVTVEAEPERVVALAPSAAQQLWAIRASETVVGMPVNQYTAYLDGREDVTDVVGEDGQPIQEAVVDLEPDLVLAPNVIDDDTVESLRTTGLTVYRYDEARSIEDVYGEIETTGRLVGSFQAAANVSAEMRGTVQAVETAVNGTDRPAVYYDLGGGWTAGANTFVDDLIETAGGENVANEAGIDGYAEISQEEVAAADPAVIVAHEGAPLPDSPAIQNATAIREDNVVRVDANYVNQPGPRNVRPLRKMAEAFHPDATASGALETPETPDPAECVAGPEAGDAGTTDGAAGPGFTVIGPVLSLVAGLLATRRC